MPSDDINYAAAALDGLAMMQGLSAGSAAIPSSSSNLIFNTPVSAGGLPVSTGLPVEVEGTVTLNAGVDPAGRARALSVDAEGRVICAPEHGLRINPGAALTLGHGGSITGTSVRMDGSISCAPDREHGWEYDFQSSLIGAGMVVLLLLALLWMTSSAADDDEDVPAEPGGEK